jgi:hypothetical protein
LLLFIVPACVWLSGIVKRGTPGKVLAPDLQK